MLNPYHDITRADIAAYNAALRAAYKRPKRKGVSEDTGELILAVVLSIPITALALYIMIGAAC